MKKKKINAAYGKIQSISGYQQVESGYSHHVLVARLVAEILIAEESRFNSHNHTSLYILHLAG